MIPVLIPDTFDLQRLYDSNGKALFDSENRAMYVTDPAPAIPTNNGLGELAEAISCIVKSQINAPGELTMVYPITGSLYADLKERCVIMAKPDRTSEPQPYRIYRITKPINGKITVYARHLAYDGLSGIPVSPFTANDIQQALASLKAKAMVQCPFTLTTTRTTAAKFSVKVPTDVWSLMGGQQGSLLDVYGGEYSFDGYTVRLENRIGQDNGVKVRYGVNMVDLEQDTNIANCYTGVVAYWQSENGEIHSPVIYAGGAYGYMRILPVDMSARWEIKPTVEQLTAAGRKYITDNQIGVPKVSWKVEMVELASTEEYKHLALLEQVSLGDTVGVEFERLGVDASSRVCSLEYDALKDRYKTITLGSVKSNIASTLAGQARAIAEMPSRVEVYNLSALIAQGIMGAKGGSVRFLDTDNDGEPDTLYIADNPDPALAQKVWRFNYLGWAASSNGYDGPFTMGATLAGGLIADFITAGTMSANRIRGGSLYVGGYNNQSGAIYFYDASGDYFGKVDNGGVRMTDSAWTATLMNRQMFAVRHIEGDVYTNIAVLNQATRLDGTNEGQLVLYKMNSDNTARVQGVAITGNGDAKFTGTLSCKRLFVNGIEITP